MRIIEMATRIKEAAKERGITLSSIAKRLGMHRSNMSAIASGSRGVSLKILKKISYFLDCSIDELISPEEHSPVFRDKNLEHALSTIEKHNYDGIDKSWVDRLMLAQKMHYGAAQGIR